MPVFQLIQILDSLREGIQVIDRDWRYRFLNAAAAEHGQRSRDALLGRTMIECFPGIEKTAVFELLQRCMRERTFATMENTFAYPEGGSRTFELRIHPCDLGIVVLSIDVTERRRLQEQLLHAQKLEAVGRLAGGVAHDFNNFLSVVLSSARFIGDALPPEHEVQEDVRAIGEAGRRAADVTRQLLAFARRQVAAPAVLDLNAVVGGMGAMLQRILGEDVQLTVVPAPSLWSTRIDAGHVEQLLANLVVNARDAMPRGGKVTIETQNVVLDEEYARRHVEASPGEHVMLAVSDTGEGMDAATRARIFEPFFTTKEKGRGTGLGLATSYGIVKQAGGNIWVYSEPGKGTTFKVYLPRAFGTAEEQRPAPDPAMIRGSEVVLVVEDDAAVRAYAERSLRMLGYRVLAAGTAGDAMKLAAPAGVSLDLLVTDVVLPDSGGTDLAARMRELHPGVLVLYVSGYTDDAIVHHGVLAPGIAFLQKPFTPEILGRKVREVLDGGRPRPEAPAPTTA